MSKDVFCSPVTEKKQNHPNVHRQYNGLINQVYLLDKILYSNENEQITVLEKTCTKPHGQNVELYIYGMVPLTGSTKRSKTNLG